MKSIASITITGNVGSDVKTPVSSNPDFTCFSLAFSSNYKNKEGSWEQKTDWYNCVCFNKNLSEVIKAQVKKGGSIVVIGSPAQRTYTDKEGKEKLSVEIIVEKIAIINRDNYSENACLYASEIKSHFVKPADREKPLAPIYSSALSVPQKTPSYMDDLDDSIPF